MFEYNDKLTALKNALVGYNTTTSSPDLSANFDNSRRIPDDNIMIADFETVGIRNRQLPAIYMRISGKDDNFETIGHQGGGGTKKAEVTFEILGLMQKQGYWTNNTNLLTELYLMARNIEGILHAEYTLSGTAQFINPTHTEFFGAEQGGDGAWVGGVLLTVKGSYWYK